MAQAPTPGASAPTKRSSRRSKRYRKLEPLVDRSKRYPLGEAVVLIRQFGTTKFDQTVNLAVCLAIDAKKADQAIRGSISLPHGIGKARKVVVFADGEDARIAQEAGADEVGTEELVKKINDGWTDFDVAIALPRMMKHVGKLGKVLGPQGKMPSPKAGTVTEDTGRAVREFRAGRVEYRVDDTANVHGPVGKKSFTEQQLVENAGAFIESIKAARPAAAKGQYIIKAAISSTMGPGIPLVVE
jgi:large subunit ribosomal protein L1